MNNAINEIKNTLEAINSRITEAEDRIHELEDQIISDQSLSHVRLFATPRTVANWAPPSMGFSRQNSGVGCHFW